MKELRGKSASKSDENKTIIGLKCVIYYEVGGVFEMKIRL